MTEDVFEDVFEDVNADVEWLPGDVFQHEFLSAWGFDEETPSPWTQEPDGLRDHLAQLASVTSSRPARGEVWLTTQSYTPTWGDPFRARSANFSCKYPKAVFIVQRDQEHDTGSEVELIDALPISFQWQYAGSHDLIIQRGEENPLDMGFMVECDMPVAVLRGQLRRPIAKLGPGTVGDILVLLHDVLGLLGGDENVASRERLLQLDRGMLIVDSDDPRPEFKRHEERNLQYLTAATYGFSEWSLSLEQNRASKGGFPQTVALPQFEFKVAAATDSGRARSEVFEFADGDLLCTVSPPERQDPTQFVFESANSELDGAWVLFFLAEEYNASVTRSGVVLLSAGVHGGFEGRYCLSEYRVETSPTLHASVLQVKDVLPAHKPVFMESWDGTDSRNRQNWKTWFSSRASEYDGNSTMVEIATDILARS